MSDYALKYNEFFQESSISSKDLVFYKNENLKSKNNDFVSNNSNEVITMRDLINLKSINNKVDSILSIIEFRLNDIDDLMVKYFINKVDEIYKMRDSIREEYDFNPPNDYVINYSKNFIKNLFNNVKIPPDRITPSAEEGLCFVFKKGNKVLYFEIYNDKEMGYIIEDEKRKIIIDNKNVSSEEDIIKVLLSF